MGSESSRNHFKTMVLTLLSLTAFAANSILCRFALEGARIDAASFTLIRICSGAGLLGLVCVVRKRTPMGTVFQTRAAPLKKKCLMPMMLTTYALFFSYAYITLGAGTGALILFGAVQATMIFSGWLSGERMTILQFAGFFLAVSGLVYLVFPGLSAPSPYGACLMALAGIAWGIYSLLGRQSADPVSTTAFNFIYSIPIVLAARLVVSFPIFFTVKGVAAAVVSGTLASGAGYVIWYAALNRLSSTRAAIVQLIVPVLAALGGLVFLSETFSLRLMTASAITLSGVGMALTRPRQKNT